MNKMSAGGVFLLCLFLGIIFDQVAIGILAGLVLGAAAGKRVQGKLKPRRHILPGVAAQSVEHDPTVVGIDGNVLDPFSGLLQAKQFAVEPFRNLFPIDERGGWEGRPKPPQQQGRHRCAGKQDRPPGHPAFFPDL